MRLNSFSRRAAVHHESPTATDVDMLKKNVLSLIHYDLIILSIPLHQYISQGQDQEICVRQNKLFSMHKHNRYSTVTDSFTCTAASFCIPNASYFVFIEEIQPAQPNGSPSASDIKASIIGARHRHGRKIHRPTDSISQQPKPGVGGWVSEFNRIPWTQ